MRLIVAQHIDAENAVPEHRIGDRALMMNAHQQVGCGVSADTETIADTVTPCRPAAPSVVTTLTVQAA
jgi:hypothetical protein